MRKLFVLLVLLFASLSFSQSDEVIEYIKKESIDGKLNFTKVAEEQSNGAAFILYNQILYNKKDFAILLWGAAVKSQGVKSLKAANSLWEEINKRELTKPEKTALKAGFETKLD